MKNEKDLGTFKLERHGKKIYVRDGVVTKVFDHKQYSFSDVLREARNQEYALEAGFPVPKVLAVYPIGEDWAVESEQIVGSTREERRKEHPENTRKFINELISIQESVLAKVCDNLKLPKLKDKLNGYISKADVDSTIRYELHARREKRPDHYKLCHGDIYPSNLILENGKWYILDWAHATRGNASADAAMTYLLFLLDGKEKEAERYLKAFCKKRNIDPAYVQQWISVVSAAKLKDYPEGQTKEVLLKNINVIEY